jgi:hypothetical protein
VQDGESLSWETSDAFRLLNVSSSSNATTTVVTITPHAGGNGYTGEPVTRGFEVEILSDTGALPAAASVNGTPRPWRNGTFGPNHIRTIVVPTGMADAAQCVEVTVSF